MVLKLNIRYISTFAWYYGFRSIARGPSYIIASLSSPLTLLFLVYILSKGQLLAYAVAGGFVSLVATVALQSSGDAAFLRLQLRIQDLFVASPISATDYMIGMTLSYVVFSGPGIILYIILGLVFHLFTFIGTIVLVTVLLILVVATSSISFIISGAIGHVRNVWGIAAILSVIMTILPPTFYPYTYIPRFYLYVLSISPVTPAAVLVQGYFGLSPVLPAMWLILIVDLTVFYVAARTLTRWREA